MVGPQVGEDLREKALFAIFFALLFITIYISGRFELKWGISGVMAGALIGAVMLGRVVVGSIPILIAIALLLVALGNWLTEEGVKQVDKRLAPTPTVQQEYYINEVVITALKNINFGI